MYDVPAHFRCRPFTRSEALNAGITRGVLLGPQFTRVHHNVYQHVALGRSFETRLAAARLALPPDACTTGITRIQQLGVELGPRSPLHFVVEGDHHLALDDVFLHRTLRMPPNEDGGVLGAAAFVAYCAEARLIDAIKVGCEMLRRDVMAVAGVEEILRHEKWRRGVPETAYVLPLLTHRCRSSPEAELRAYVVAACLPAPEVNTTVEIAPGLVVTPDEWWGDFTAAVEYEGTQHQEERGQYIADIDRYAAYRRCGVAYELVTKERLRSPTSVVRTINRMLRGRGYDGPPPQFGDEWRALSLPIRRLVRPTVPRQR